MRKGLNKGESTLEGVVMLSVLIVIMFLVGVGPSSNNSGGSSRNTSFSQGERADLDVTSSFEGEVSIGRGNASRAYQTYEEYITLKNRGGQSINLTGWKLENAKSERVYDPAGQPRVFPNDSPYIPQATLLLSPTGANVLQNLVLERGEEAVITTGKVGVKTPYEIVSFKENMCTGYIEELDQYEFQPSLSRRCPDPEDEPGVSGLDQECRKFIDRLSRCETPDFAPRDKEGEDCSSCVNGTLLGSSCVAFIRERYNYQGCVAYHANEPDFYSNKWRVFLGQDWELWAEDYERIKLYDSVGQLVDFESY